MKLLFLIFIFCSIANGQPQNLKVQANCADTCKAVVSWQKNIEPDVVLYTVYRGIRSGEYFRIATVAHPDTSVIIDSLLVNVAYYFTVTATDTAMNESAYSAEVRFIVEDTTALQNEITDDFDFFNPAIWAIGTNSANATTVAGGKLQLRSTDRQAGWVHTVNKITLRGKTVDVLFAKTGGSCNVGFSPTVRTGSIDGIISESNMMRVYVAYVSATSRGIFIQEKKNSALVIDDLLVEDPRFQTSPVALRLAFTESAMVILYSFDTVEFFPVNTRAVDQIYLDGSFVELSSYYTISWGEADVDKFTLSGKTGITSKYDFNKDGKVDTIDWVLLLKRIGMRSIDAMYRQDIDLNRDGWIDGIDLAIFAKNSNFI